MYRIQRGNCPILGDSMWRVQRHIFGIFWWTVLDWTYWEEDIMPYLRPYKVNGAIYDKMDRQSLR